MRKLFSPGLLFVPAILVPMLACGPDPEPVTASNPPTPSVTAPPPASSTPPPPAEPTAEQRKANAKAALDAKDWAKAKVELGALLAKSPDDIEANKLLGQAFEGEGNPAGAAEAYAKASKADGGKDEQLALTAVGGLFALHKFDDVVALAAIATKANEKSRPLWMFLALGQNGKGDHAGAAETWTKLTTGWPDEPQLWAHLALSQATAGKGDDAKKTAKTALDKWKDANKAKGGKEVQLGHGADELALIARAQRRAGDNKAALATADVYKAGKDEITPSLDIERGFAKAFNKDGAGAKKHGELLLKAKGDGFAPGHLVLAAAHLAAKKVDDAKAELAKYDGAGAEGGKGHHRFAWERKAIEEWMSSPAMTAAPVKKGK
ncbi:MAG: hypothetical protein IPJ34_35405 [Myxococcales bacterium]|nr:hypothetical protein [Myxococcales bacterium]